MILTDWLTVPSSSGTACVKFWAKVWTPATLFWGTRRTNDLSKYGTLLEREFNEMSERLGLPQAENINEWFTHQTVYFNNLHEPQIIWNNTHVYIFVLALDNLTTRYQCVLVHAERIIQNWIHSHILYLYDKYIKEVFLKKRWNNNVIFVTVRLFLSFSLVY